MDFFLYSIPYFFGGLSINVLIMTQASRDVSTKLKKMFKLKLITPILNDSLSKVLIIVFEC